MAQAVTGSIALEQLKNDLTALASNLRELHGTLISQMNALGDSWQDIQYQQFVDGYKPKIEKCAEIADRYDYGCKNFLAPQIENVRAIEHTDLGSGNVVGIADGTPVGSTGDGFSGGGTAAAVGAAAGVGIAGVAGIAAGATGISGGGSSKFSNFNMGVKGGASSVPPAKNQADDQKAWEEKHQMSLDTEHYYIDQNGNAVRKPFGSAGDNKEQGEVVGVSNDDVKSTQGDFVNENPNSTVSTYKKVCTTEGVDVYGIGAHGKTCETTYPDGSKKTEIETCTQSGVSVNGLGGLGAKSTVEGCTVTEINTPAPSGEDATIETPTEGVLDNPTAGNEVAPPVEVTGRRIVPRPKRGASDNVIDAGDTAHIEKEDVVVDMDGGHVATSGAEGTVASSPSYPLGVDASAQLENTRTGFTPFPDGGSVRESLDEAPLHPAGSACNTPTSINETTITNTTINNTVVNNTTINNTTINNTTINSDTENIVSKNESSINFQTSDIKTKDSASQEPILPKPDQTSFTVDGTEYHRTGNPSGIDDIPYTPFPEAADNRKVVPRPLPDPTSVPEQAPTARRSMLGGRPAGARVSGILGNGGRTRISPRKEIADNQVANPEVHKRVIDATNVVSKYGKHSNGRHRKDRFGI